MAVRGHTDHYFTPHSFSTSERVDSFFNLSMNMPVDQVSLRMEGYTLSGVHGMFLS